MLLLKVFYRTRPTECCTSHYGVWASQRITSQTAVSTLMMRQSRKFGKKFDGSYILDWSLTSWTFSDGIIQEIQRDEPSRSNFYFSTQIVFGAIVLYRDRVTKLFSKSEYILIAVCCLTHFFAFRPDKDDSPALHSYFLWDKLVRIQS